MKKKYSILVIINLFLLLIFNSCSMDRNTSDSMNKEKISAKADSILSLMTIDEKIGQMMQVDMLAVENNPDHIKKYFFGSLLAGGNSELDDISAKGWADMYDGYQKYALDTRLKIPIIFGIDAVHGNNNIKGAVIFPHNIGFGCTGNPSLVEKAARVTAEEVAATGVDWTFAPCVAVTRNERWGRTYESFGEDPALVKELGAAAVKGYQGDDLSSETSILACTKHYVGDGGTTDGIDRGNTECSEEELRKIHLPGYEGAIEENTATIMASYSSWNGEKLHGHKYLLTDVLKNELGFDGFLVSDWAAIDQLGPDYKSDVEKSINAGLDMVMIPNGEGTPNNYIQFHQYLKELVEEGKVPVERIDDAVRRILKIKLAMGLFNRPFANRKFISKVGSDKHREVARECVRQSLVLLKNDNETLPLSKNLKRIHVSGKSADNLGNQCGGWTINWQGESGQEIAGGTSVLQAIKNTVDNSTMVTYSIDGSNAEGADAAIVVIGETPYAEIPGDRKDLSLSAEDMAAIKNAKLAGIPVVVILVSGRPMLINEALENCDSFIAAWLPGSEGQGIADVLFGDYSPTGKLSVSWPRNMEQIPINIGDENYDPLFPYGYGLTY